MPAESPKSLKKWECPAKSSIWIREFVYTKKSGGEDKAYSAYQVTVPAKVTGRGRKRAQFKTRREAEDWAKLQNRGREKQGSGFFNATDSERREFSHVMIKLKEVDLGLTEAVEFAIRRLRPAGGGKPLEAIVSELVEIKESRYKKGGLRERSFRDFRQRSARFSEAFAGTAAASITSEDLREWLASTDLSSRSVRNYLAVIAEIFKYGVQKKYLAASPVDDLADHERKELCGDSDEFKEPSMLSIKEAKRLLLAAWENRYLDLLPSVVLGLFCGIRTEEIKRLDWSDVKLNEKVVTIHGNIAKKRRIRHVDIPENAVLWLQDCGQKKGPVAPSENWNEYQNRFSRKLLRIAGFGSMDESGNWKSSWVVNAMRHSFGTYHYALYGNPLETSRQLGHKSNDQVLFDHYRALATKEQGKAFFSIEPPKSESKLVEFVG